MSRNEAAVELLLTYGSRLDIRGSKKEIKDGQVFTPPELAAKFGFSKFHQISKGVQSKKEEAERKEAERKEAEKKEVERKKKETEQKETEKKKSERKEDTKEEKKGATNEPKKPNTGETDAEKKDPRQKAPEERVTVPKDWMKKYKAKKEHKKEEVKIPDEEQRESNGGVGKEPEMKEPQSNGSEVEEPDTKGPMNTEPKRREIEPEKSKSEKNEEDIGSGKEKDLKKKEVGKEEKEKKDKLQNPLDLEILRQKSTGQGQDSMGKTDDIGHQYQRSLSAGSCLFLGILLEAEKLLKLPHNSKMSTLCKETFGSTSFSRMFSSLIGNQRLFCLMVLSQLFPELTKKIEANYNNINLKSSKGPDGVLHYFDALIKSGVTENVDRGVVFVLGNTKVGKTSLVNTLRNFLENPDKKPEPVLADETNGLTETQVLEYYDKIKLQHSKKLSVKLTAGANKTELIEFGEDDARGAETKEGTQLNMKLVDMGGHQEYYACSELHNVNKFALSKNLQTKFYPQEKRGNCENFGT